MNLSILIILPFITALAVLFCKGLKQVRTVSLIGVAAQFILSLDLLFVYWKQRAADNNSPFLFEYDFTWFTPLNIHYHIGVDGISVAMILLTAFVVIAGVLVSWMQETLNKEFFFLLLFLSVGAYGYFISLDIFTLFFFLEVAVIPKFLLIGIWGSGKKEYSAMKLALMLMGGSALVFVGLAGLYYGSNLNGEHSFDLTLISQMHINLLFQKIFFPFAFIGFGIFTALFPFHTWVPDGHTSAPTAASMFLAGISMKLGGYGCLRVATYLMPDAAHIYSPYIIILSTIAIIYGAFATMMQKDLKYINAYSSVSHCGFVLLGIGMLTQTSINGITWINDCSFLRCNRYAIQQNTYPNGGTIRRVIKSNSIYFNRVCYCRFVFIRITGLQRFCCRDDCIYGELAKPRSMVSLSNHLSLCFYCCNRCIYFTCCRKNSDGAYY